MLCLVLLASMINGAASWGVCRFQAQQDAVNLLAGAKTQANPESTVSRHALPARAIQHAYTLPCRVRPTSCSMVCELTRPIALPRQSPPQVGVLTMAGKTPRVLVTPTPDLGKVLNSMASLEIEGEANFAAAVQIAQLALKHRQNKNQRQRIVIFVGSPLGESQVRHSHAMLASLLDCTLRVMLRLTNAQQSTMARLSQ